MSFKLRSLTLAVATLSAMSAHSAGLDRSGQDITGFLQDGTYADVIYTHIDADISGKDRGIDGKGTNAKEVKDIAPEYNFFRYNVKTDLNDRISVGVLYDEPFGAKVEYSNGSNFAGDMDNFARPQIANFATDQTINVLTAQFENVLTEWVANEQDPNLAPVYEGLSTAVGGNLDTLTKVKDMNENGKPIQEIVDYIKQQLQLSERLQPAVTTVVQNVLANTEVSAADKNKIMAIAGQLKTQSDDLKAKIPPALATLESLADRGATNVEVHTKNLTGLVGVKLGEKRNVQVYAGPAVQKLEGEVHLRGNAYNAAGGYDAQIAPDMALGWVAGVSYSKPEIALKASLTYRSEIEHKTDISEFYPLAPLAGQRAGQVIPQSDRREFKVTLPESYNLDFQTGLSAKHRLLGTAKVRYVPWSDFAITPPLYNQVSKTVSKDGYNIVDYSKDQWSAELGLAKQVNNKLAVSGTVGWDSGAGNPATSLGPVEGYYSVGLGAKYNITPEWALSAGAKYLKFGDATARLPDGSTEVGDFEDNDGYIVGIKLSYQKK